MKKVSSKLILLRVLLGILILCNAVVIFLFSAQSGEESDRTSLGVTTTVAQIVVKDFEDLSQEDRDAVVAELHPLLRKLAHMLEFGTLGSLIFLLLITWGGNLLLKWASALGATLLYAIGDEWHQSFSDGRGPQAEDVLIDLLGAVLLSSLLLLLACLIRHSNRWTRVTRYTIDRGTCGLDLKIAVVADLHGAPYEPHLEALKREKPDMILIPGDLMEDIELVDEHAMGYEFLRACADLAPTYYSLGNHEIACYHKGNPWRHPTPVFPNDEVRARVAQTGAVLLENDSVEVGELRICGLTSGINGKENHPDIETVKTFAKASGFRILLCHHPEYYVPYLRDTGIELTVCGHAHGGHWRFFGRGVYAPGQGLFPKYTSGMIDGRCVISRGIGNHTWIPRICNPTELVIITCGAPSQKADLPRKYQNGSTK